jgi:SAM-dependent methyltransferase
MSAPTAGAPGAADTRGERFCIKPGYRPYPPRSYDRERGAAYWRPARLAAAARHQHPVYLLCRDLLRARRASSFLDVGSGPGVKVAELIAPQCPDLTLVDQPSSRALVASHVPGAHFVAADLDGPLPELGRRFDLIVCADVLEHLAHPDRCVRFIRDHLADGGCAVLSTPERDRLRGRQCMESLHPEHVREWNAAEFRVFVESCGLAVERQRLLPPVRTGRLELAAARLLGGFAPRRWASCQVAVCRRSGSDR